MTLDDAQVRAPSRVYLHARIGRAGGRARAGDESELDPRLRAVAGAMCSTWSPRAPFMRASAKSAPSVAMPRRAAQ